MTKVTYLGHAGVLLENNDLTLLQDPWLDRQSEYTVQNYFAIANDIPK